ncbi:MAG: hypothetical protein AABX16_03630 [Nanoarchaeota archaeon]
MGWSELPTWVKGGVILSGIYLVFFLTIQIILNQIIIDSPLGFLFYLLLIYYPVGFILSFFPREIFVEHSYDVLSEFTILGWIIGLIGVLLITFIIGALIGWIYGKIKGN